jgi:hypothetical protein
MSREYDDDDRGDDRDEDRDDYERRPLRAQPSGAVTAVGVVNLVLGGLDILAGILVMVGGAAFLGLGAGAANQEGLTEEQKKAIAGAGAMGAGLIAAIGVCIMIFGIPLILAGIGVLKRRNWGRILTIVLGFIAGLFGVLSLLNHSFVGAVIYIAYCVFVLVVLFSSKFAKEFA